MARAKRARRGKSKKADPAALPPVIPKRPPGRPRTIDSGSKTIIYRVSDDQYAGFAVLAERRHTKVNVVARDLSLEALKAAADG